MGAFSALYVGVNGFTSTCLPVFASIWQCFPMTTMLAWLSSSVCLISDLSFIISSASYFSTTITSYIRWLYIDVCGCCIFVESIQIFHVLWSPWITICAGCCAFSSCISLLSEENEETCMADIIRLVYSWPA